MPTSDWSTASWRRSQRCGSANTSCIEVALRDDGVAIRDSKDPSGAILVFDYTEWTAFVEGVVDGDFNRG